MSTFHERKSERTEHFHRFINGWKQRTCGACSGSGHYDHNGSPKCGGCGGTGKERFPPANPPPPNHQPLIRLETAAEELPFKIAYYSQPGIHIPKYRSDLDHLRPLVAAERARIATEKAEAWTARRAPGMHP